MLKISSWFVSFLFWGFVALTCIDADDPLRMLNSPLKFLKPGWPRLHANLKEYMGFSESFFASRFGITRGDLESYLAEALSRGGDYADVYFEYLSTSHISIDESIVKNAAEGVSLGVGVRVIAGERTGYAYSDDLSPEKVRQASRVAACIAAGPAKIEKTALQEGQTRNLYPVLMAPNETGFTERVDLVKRADAAARGYDTRIFQVQATYADNLRS